MAIITYQASTFYPQSIPLAAQDVLWIYSTRAGVRLLVKWIEVYSSQTTAGLNTWSIYKRSTQNSINASGQLLNTPPDDQSIDL